MKEKVGNYKLKSRKGKERISNENYYDYIQMHVLRIFDNCIKLNKFMSNPQNGNPVLKSEIKG